jgi:hypothetical protein
VGERNEIAKWGRERGREVKEKVQNKNTNTKNIYKK